MRHVEQSRPGCEVALFANIYSQYLTIIVDLQGTRALATCIQFNIYLPRVSHLPVHMPNRHVTCSRRAESKVMAMEGCPAGCETVHLGFAITRSSWQHATPRTSRAVPYLLPKACSTLMVSEGLQWMHYAVMRCEYLPRRPLVVKDDAYDCKAPSPFPCSLTSNQNPSHPCFQHTYDSA